MRSCTSAVSTYGGKVFRSCLAPQRLARGVTRMSVVALNFSSACADLKVGATSAYADLKVGATSAYADLLTKSGQVPVGATFALADPLPRSGRALKVRAIGTGGAGPEAEWSSAIKIRGLLAAAPPTRRRPRARQDRFRVPQDRLCPVRAPQRSGRLAQGCSVRASGARRACCCSAEL